MRPMTRAPLRYRLALTVYQAALGLMMPLVWRYFRRRGEKDPDYISHLDERRGTGPDRPADIWIHAVSLGEFRSAEPLIARLLTAGQTLVITHATPAGRRASERALATEISAGRVQVCYAPIDRVSYWARFFARTTPRAGLVMEMEFWPGMIEAAARAGVPLWLTNSQIPGRSFPRALRVKALLGAHAAGRTRGVFAKSDRMAERFRELGASDVRAMGETRFDIEAPARHLAAGERLAEHLDGRPIYTFASVVEGEEESYLAAVRDLFKDKERPLIIWVPRAPEVFDMTFKRLEDAGLIVMRRSAAFDDDLTAISPLDTCEVLLGDSFGEMFFYLAAASAVSVGGGFVEKGAHNIIEPLKLGKPVVTGPHIWTIEFPGEEARSVGVLSVCTDPATLGDMLKAAANTDPTLQNAFHAAHSGASDRIADAVLKEITR